MKTFLKKNINTVLAVGLFFLLACIITYPLIFHLGSIATGKGDELLLSWIQNWVVHSVSTNPMQLFQAPIFYPLPHALAYSDTLITSSLIAWPFVNLISQPIAFQNITLILSLTLLGLSTYLLTYYLSKDQLASFLAGVLVIFSPVVLDKYVHLQVLFIFFVPLSFLLFFQFLKTYKTKYLFGTMVCFVLQTLNSFLPGYFILFGLIIIFLMYFCAQKINLKKILNKATILILFFSFAVLVPLIIPYYQVSQMFGYTRDIRDAIHFAIQPEDLYYSQAFTRLSPHLETATHRNTYPSSTSFKNGYPGLVFVFLTIISVVYLIKHWGKQGLEIKSVSFIGLTGLVLSLGPFLHLGRQTIHDPFPIPLPYAVLYYLIPGFNGMRNSARWEMLFVISFAVVGVIICLQILKRVGGYKKTAVLLVLMVLVFLEYKPSFTFVTIAQKENFPKEYQWLSQQPKDIVYIDMPIYNWNFFPYAVDELQRQYYSTLHFRRSVNGASGFSPPPWQKMVVNITKTFPQDNTLIELKKMGVDYILVHSDEYDRLNRDRYKVEQILIPSGSTVLTQLKKSEKVNETTRFGSTYIYKLL